MPYSINSLLCTVILPVPSDDAFSEWLLIIAVSLNSTQLIA
jgi:hypothetical protein